MPTSVDALIATCLQAAETIQLHFPLTAQMLRQMVSTVHEDERRQQEQIAELASAQEQHTASIDIIRAETGGYCLAINNRRVAGPKPSPTINNVLRTWTVKRKTILDALERSEEGDENVESGNSNGS